MARIQASHATSAKVASGKEPFAEAFCDLTAGFGAGLGVDARGWAWGRCGRAGFCSDRESGSRGGFELTQS